MRATNIILASGLAIATLATPTLAQSRDNDDTQDRIRDRQDRLGDAGRTIQQDRERAAATNILTSLEGIWKVNVRVNRTQWDALDRMGQHRTDPDRPGTDRGLDSTNPDQRDDRNPRERDAEREDTERDRQNGTREQARRDREQIQERRERGQEQSGRDRDGANPSRSDASRSGGIESADGMARSHAILGGDILRTKVIFGTGTATQPTTTRQAPDSQDRDAERNPRRDNDRDSVQRNGTSTTTPMSATDTRNLQSMSFLGYDQNSGEYNLALMTGKSGSIHYFTGKYDQAERRIIFKSVDSSPVSTSTTDRRSTTTPSTSGSSVTTTTGTQMEGMTVVLQMDGNDTYSVTAYRGSTAQDSGARRGTDLGGQPARDQNRENRRDARRDTGDRQNQDASRSMISPNVIYKATYTRADSSMRSQHDRMFDEREREDCDALEDRRDGTDREDRTPTRDR